MTNKKVEDMTPKQIWHYHAFQRHLQKIINGSIKAVRRVEVKVDYADIDYTNNPNNLIARVTIYSGQKIFAIITAYKTKKGPYCINYESMGKSDSKDKFKVKDGATTNERSKE